MTKVTKTEILVPIAGDAIDVETTEIKMVAGDTVTLTLAPSVTGKLTIAGSSDGIFISFAEGPFEGQDDPPPNIG